MVHRKTLLILLVIIVATIISIAIIYPYTVSKTNNTVSQRRNPWRSITVNNTPVTIRYRISREKALTIATNYLKKLGYTTYSVEKIEEETDIFNIHYYTIFFRIGNETASISIDKYSGKIISVFYKNVALHHCPIVEKIVPANITENLKILNITEQKLLDLLEKFLRENNYTFIDKPGVEIRIEGISSTAPYLVVVSYSLWYRGLNIIEASIKLDYNPCIGFSLNKTGFGVELPIWILEDLDERARVDYRV